MLESSFQLFQKQQKFLADLKIKRPDLFTVAKIFNEDEVLPQIGITALDPKRPEGFLRLYPQDFIVEEIQTDKSLSVIEPKDTISPPARGGVRGGGSIQQKFTLYADLVKVGISTLEAINRLASALQIPPEKIGYAGIKDGQALTSQRIALPRITYEQVRSLPLESFFLTNFFYGKGSIAPGDLLGNRFTIFVRTEKHFPRKELKEKLTLLKEKGFLNYYHTQRFGGSRFLSHILGKLILQKKYEEAVKTFLITPNYCNIKIVQGVRDRAAAKYGEWQEMKKIFSILPYTFKNEIRILEYLEQSPKNFIGALINLEDQAQFWVYAYASLVFNQYLSAAQENNFNLPDEIPLLLTNSLEEQNIYKNFLEADQIQNIREALQPF
ncbi:MAG: tRNA pseudouridine(13) synthase TruD, partial [bacterium]|nr:tRNA pseudouridine(13) synthase TruD [bacterium]